jgi:coenzyme PQQ precursor peptide PqqA
MTWNTPVVVEVAVGMEVTSYESAEIDTFNSTDEGVNYGTNIRI